MMCLVASFQACSQETTDPVTHDPVMSTSIRGPAFPRGLQFSADGATVWINSLDALYGSILPERYNLRHERCGRF